MAQENKNQLKTYFQNGLRPTEDNFENLIESAVNFVDDKATTAVVETGTDDVKFVTPAGAKASVLKFAPVKKVNGNTPNSSGDVTVTNITGSAGSLTGSVTQSQVTGLVTDLSNKQPLLTGGDYIKKINNVSLVGSGNITVGFTKLIGIPATAFTLSNTVTTVQTAFPASCDTFALSANKTYLIKGKYLISTGATTHTTSMAFAATGGLTFSTFEYVARIFSAAANTGSGSITATQVTGNGVKVLNATSALVTTTIEFEGALRTGAGGSLTPQVAFSAASGGTNLMKLGSFVEITEIGANTVEAVGTVA